jgi:RNA polymerase sigma factor (sigma-70 family)
MTEQELACVIAAKKGSPGGFEELFKMFYKRVYVLANSRLRNVAESEDVSQQTFISVWNNLDTLREPEAFAGWLTRITINQCNAVQRKNTKDVSLSEGAPHAEAGDYQDMANQLPETNTELLPEAQAERNDLHQRMNILVSSLNDEQREAVILYYYQQLSVSEIAQATGVGNNTVKSRLSQARKQIKRRMEAEETRTGAKFFSVSGVATAALGAALAEHFAQMEPPTEAVDAAYTQFNETISAGNSGSVAGAALPYGATSATGDNIAYVDKYVSEMRSLAAVELPLSPHNSAWSEPEPPANAQSPLSVNDYLQPIRDYTARLKSAEQQYLRAGEDLLKLL